MKNIAALITALILSFISVTAVHFAVAGSVNDEGVAFDTWINPYKNKSYSAIKANITDKTVLYMGSSEFNHSKSKPAHPTNLFRKSDMEVMCLGTAFTQSLTMAITTGAISKDMKNKKAVLLVSPSWFTKKGVKGTAFAMRFSESQYEQLMQNPGISQETKKQISARVSELLSGQKDMLGQAKTADNIYLNGSSTFRERLNFALRKLLVQERDAVSVVSMWLHYKHTTDPDRQVKKNDPETPDFDKMLHDGEQEFIRNSTNNSFNMLDKSFNSRFRSRAAKAEGMYARKSYRNSVEYGDLKLFLDVCRQSGMQVMVVMLPVNGPWYDHTGFRPENRNIVSEKVKNMTEKYRNVTYYDMFDKCYETGFFEDNVHPSGKGWVMINEKVYEFFR